MAKRSSPITICKISPSKRPNLEILWLAGTSTKWPRGSKRVTWSLIHPQSKLLTKFWSNKIGLRDTTRGHLAIEQSSLIWFRGSKTLEWSNLPPILKDLELKRRTMANSNPCKTSSSRPCSILQKVSWSKSIGSKRQWVHSRRTDYTIQTMTSHLSTLVSFPLNSPFSFQFLFFWNLYAKIIAPFSS